MNVECSMFSSIGGKDERRGVSRWPQGYKGREKLSGIRQRSEPPIFSGKGKRHMIRTTHGASESLGRGASPSRSVVILFSTSGRSAIAYTLFSNDYTRIVAHNQSHSLRLSSRCLHKTTLKLRRYQQSLAIISNSPIVTTRLSIDRVAMTHTQERIARVCSDKAQCCNHYQELKV